jgi:hypothetical protein
MLVMVRVVAVVPLDILERAQLAVKDTAVMAVIQPQAAAARVPLVLRPAPVQVLIILLGVVAVLDFMELVQTERLRVMVLLAVLGVLVRGRGPYMAQRVEIMVVERVVRAP